VTAGAGWIQEWGGGRKQEIRPGESLDAAGKEALAWRHGDDVHDAHGDLEQLNGKSVDWMEKVNDEQYQAPPER
jgi:hypothetical protein